MQSFPLRKTVRRHGNVGNLRRSAVNSLKIGVIHAGTQTVLSEANWHVVRPDRQEQHNLGPDEQVAKQKYHALMAGRQPVAEDTAAYGALLQFLGWNTRPRDRGPSNRRRFRAFPG